MKNLFSILKPGNRISQRAISGVLWIGISKTIFKLFPIIRTVILPRLLSPNDFGLFGIALITLSVLQTITQPGMMEALVQDSDSIDEALDSAWSIKLVRGIILFIIIFTIAPWVASFLNEPKATYLIYIIGSSLIFSGLGNPGIIYFTKNIEFKKQSLYEITGSFVDLVVSIVLCMILKNAFALAYGYLSGIIALSFISYVLHPYRPWFTLNSVKINKMLKFGRWIWGNYIITFILVQGVGLFIGKILGSIALGFFQMAQKITSMVTDDIAMIFYQISFPVYSKLQNDIKKLREAYCKFLKIISIIVIPTSLVFCIFSKSITYIILGSKWDAITPIVSILAIYGMLLSLSDVNKSILKSVGRPDIITKIQAIKAIVVAAALIPLFIRYKLSGIVISLLISELLLLPVEFCIISGKIELRFHEIAKIISIPALNGAVPIILMNFVINSFNLSYKSIIIFTFCMIISIILYVCFSFMTDVIFNFGFRRVFNKNYIMNALGVNS